MQPERKFPARHNFISKVTQLILKTHFNHLNKQQGCFLHQMFEVCNDVTPEMNVGWFAFPRISLVKNKTFENGMGLSGMWTHTCIHIYTHIDTLTYTHIHAHIYTHTRIHIYTHTYTHIHAYRYTHIHAYRYTHIHM